MAHEQAAAMMADSYSRFGPNFAATMVTSGPGATNLLTGKLVLETGDSLVLSSSTNTDVKYISSILETLNQ